MINIIAGLLVFGFIGVLYTILLINKHSEILKDSESEK